MNIKEFLVKNNIYSVEEHKERATNELLERGYEKDVIDLWVNAIE